MHSPITKQRWRRAGCCLITVGALWVVPDVAWSQSEASDLAPARGEFEAAPLPPPEHPFFIPDVPQDMYEKTQVRQRWVTIKFGLVMLADYTAFNQDGASVSQVGTQEDQWEVRSARAMVRGAIGHDYKVGYLFAAEYKGFETDPEVTWQVTDVSFTFPLAGPGTKLTAGKTKETFAYEMIGDAANLAQQERVLSPFFVSRNVGIKLTQVLGKDHRMTASAGVFNDWWVHGDSFAKSGTDVSGRFTGLLWDRNEGTSFLHLGVAGRYAGADNNTLRYKGRPESNVADNYVDSGNLSADHAWHQGLEALWNEGPYSLLAEYDRAQVISSASGDPTFIGYYVTASWIPTGETRPYDRTVGYARRVMPRGRWGAPELVGRFSHVDLNDGVVHGGAFDKTYLGLNWWATRRWKLGGGWGHTRLDRSSLNGVTDNYMMRFQWIF